MVDPQWVAGHYKCWNEPICASENGGSVAPERCCYQKSRHFRNAYNDLHNLVPVVGQLNGNRKGAAYSTVSGERRLYGLCDIEIEDGLLEPPERVRGDIARIYFYMEKYYGAKNSSQQRKVLERWSREDPPDEWEKERNRRIRRAQGNGNEFVESVD